MAGHAATGDTARVDTPHSQRATQFPPEVKQIKRWKRVVIWIIGVVLASLIPFAWASQSSKPGDRGPSMYILLGSGDLYLVSVIVLIAGLTEIVLLMRQLDEFTVALLVLAAIFFVIIDAARYAGASAITTNANSPPHSIAYLSLVAFGLAAAHSSICVSLAAGKNG